MTGNLGHTVYSIVFDIVHPPSWLWSEETATEVFKENLPSVCCCRPGKWKGTLCFWKTASCKQGHLLEYKGAQDPGDSQRVSAPEQSNTVKGWQGHEEQLSVVQQVSKLFPFRLPRRIPEGILLLYTTSHTTQVLRIYTWKHFADIHMKKTNKASHRINKPCLNCIPNKALKHTIENKHIMGREWIILQPKQNQATAKWLINRIILLKSL